LIGEQLRRLRIDKGYGLEAVAKAVRMSKFRLYKIEHGKYLHFDVRQLNRLKEYYYTSLTEILSVIPDTSFDNLVIDNSIAT